MEFQTHEIAERVLETCNGIAISTSIVIVVAAVLLCWVLGFKCESTHMACHLRKVPPPPLNRLHTHTLTTTPNQPTTHPADTPFRFRLNWGAGGKRLEATPEFSLFVGDLAPEVTDTLLHEAFVERFPSTLGAKVRAWVQRPALFFCFFGGGWRSKTVVGRGLDWVAWRASELVCLLWMDRCLSD